MKSKNGIAYLMEIISHEIDDDHFIVSDGKELHVYSKDEYKMIPSRKNENSLTWGITPLKYEDSTITSNDPNKIESGSVTSIKYDGQPLTTTFNDTIDHDSTKIKFRPIDVLNNILDKEDLIQDRDDPYKINDYHMDDDGTVNMTINK